MHDLGRWVTAERCCPACGGARQQTKREDGRTLFWRFDSNEPLCRECAGDYAEELKEGGDD